MYVKFSLSVFEDRKFTDLCEKFVPIKCMRYKREFNSHQASFYLTDFYGPTLQLLLTICGSFKCIIHCTILLG